jgi:hypothetical protein
VYKQFFQLFNLYLDISFGYKDGKWKQRRDAKKRGKTPEPTPATSEPPKAAPVETPPPEEPPAEPAPSEPAPETTPPAEPTEPAGDATPP